MSEREHDRAVRAALKTNKELLQLFGRLGTKEHPNGRILTAYRQARRAMKGNVSSTTTVREIMQELRQAVADAAYTTLQVAAQVGTQQAKTTLAIYGLPNGQSEMPMILEPYNAWMATVEQQSAAILALSMQDNEEAILGDSSRVGILSPAPVVREGARWLTVAALAALTTAYSRAGTDGSFQRQVVAAIDERTTDCCLQAHGQVVGMREKFHLSGTPRYADRMDAPPFHWYCRSSVALVRAEDVDDDLSRQMIVAARDEMEARVDTGVRVEIHPASATSRR